MYYNSAPTTCTCSAPLHVALTESILCHGGTQELIRILNRLGAAASLDTVNRLATNVVTKRIAEGVSADLKPGMYATATVDNIDIIQPFAFVSCLDASRSWHGTSVQCIQPLPETEYLSQDLVPSSHASQLTTRTHIQTTSPVNTPIPHEKHKRRRRTLTEFSPHTSITVAPKKNSTVLQDKEVFQSIHTAEYVRLQTDSELSIAQFRPTAVEEASLKVLQEDLFKCITLRSFSPPQIFPSLVSLLNCVKRQTYDKEVSNIEVVSEKADSKPTLVGVIARLHKLFLIDHGQKHVFLVMPRGVAARGIR